MSAEVSKAQGACSETNRSTLMPEIIEVTLQSRPAVQDIYNVSDVAALLGISKNKVWKLARRPEDPLPLRRMPNQERGGIVFREELVAWAKRNFTRVGTN